MRLYRRRLRNHQYQSRRERYNGMNVSTQLQTSSDLKILVEEIGFLPLFHNAIPGFSVEELTSPSSWFDGQDHDP